MPLYSRIPIVTAAVAYTPIITGFGTVTNLVAYSQRMGDRLIAQISFATGTTTAVPAQVTIGFNGVNGNVTIDNGKLATATSSVIGFAAINAAAAQQYCPISDLTNQSFFYIGLQGAVGGGGLTGANGSSIIVGSGVYISMQISVPIVGWTAYS